MKTVQNEKKSSNVEPTPILSHHDACIVNAEGLRRVAFRHVSRAAVDAQVAIAMIEDGVVLEKHNIKRIAGSLRHALNALRELKSELEHQDLGMTRTTAAVQ